MLSRLNPNFSKKIGLSRLNPNFGRNSLLRLMGQFGLIKKKRVEPAQSDFEVEPA